MTVNETNFKNEHHINIIIKALYIITIFKCIKEKIIKSKIRSIYTVNGSKNVSISSGSTVLFNVFLEDLFNYIKRIYMLKTFN